MNEIIDESLMEYTYLIHHLAVFHGYSQPEWYVDTRPGARNNSVQESLEALLLAHIEEHTDVWSYHSKELWIPHDVDLRFDPQERHVAELYAGYKLIKDIQR